MARKSLEERIREMRERWAKAKERQEGAKAKRKSLRPRKRREPDPGKHSESDDISRGCFTIYFIQVGEDGPIKIGRTTQSPLQRMDTLQTGIPIPLRLLAIISHVGASAEMMLHRRFYHLHVQGEWFRPDEELLTYIRENALPWNLRRDQVPKWWWGRWDLRNKEMVEDSLRFPELFQKDSLGIWETYDAYLEWRRERLSQIAHSEN
jgi:hypothetical protein